jgi:diguanylate cyclase (GGDEF)-like protein
MYAKASIGSAADLQTAGNIGSRIARRALDQGSPIVVSDIAKAGLTKAPVDWRYKTSSFISFPLMIGDRRIAVLNFTDRSTGEAFGEHDLELLQTIAPQIAVALDRTALKDRAGQFQQLSVTDPLTGLLNRRYLDERLIEEMNRARRHRSPISLMMIDVDNFKSYNDSFGHLAGDAALKTVSDAMKDTLRADDVAARFGGEEFSILLPRTNIEEAAAIAERIRMRIEHTKFPHRPITISLGIAGYSNEFETPKDWITAADMALYEAKHMGRNNVQVYDNMGRSFKERIN